MKDVNSSFFSLFVGTLLSITIWLSIIITTDPYKTDPITKAAFFASLFLGLAGLLSFVFIYIQSSRKDMPIKKLLSSAIVHSSLFSFALVLVLLLKSINVLGWWEIVIILLLVILTEFFLLTQRGVSDNA